MTVVKLTNMIAKYFIVIYSENNWVGFWVETLATKGIRNFMKLYLSILFSIDVRPIQDIGSAIIQAGAFHLWLSLRTYDTCAASFSIHLGFSCKSGWLAPSPLAYTPHLQPSSQFISSPIDPVLLRKSRSTNMTTELLFSFWRIELGEWPINL